MGTIKRNKDETIKQLKEMVHQIPDNEKLRCIMYDGRMEYIAPPVLMAVCFLIKNWMIIFFGLDWRKVFSRAFL